ncbi:hypothetical protein Bbelb_042390 [Branchiostoma belcheri]|nr:hypothetical protein Bbelb_042390 [Branchiostoma belcheri]
MGWYQSASSRERQSPIKPWLSLDFIIKLDAFIQKYTHRCLMETRSDGDELGLLIGELDSDEENGNKQQTGIGDASMANKTEQREKEKVKMKVLELKVVFKCTVSLIPCQKAMPTAEEGPWMTSGHTMMTVMKTC